MDLETSFEERSKWDIGMFDQLDKFLKSAEFYDFIERGTDLCIKAVDWKISKNSKGSTEVDVVFTFYEEVYEMYRTYMLEDLMCLDWEEKISNREAELEREEARKIAIEKEARRVRVENEERELLRQLKEKYENVDNKIYIDLTNKNRKLSNDEMKALLHLHQRIASDIKFTLQGKEMIERIMNKTHMFLNLAGELYQFYDKETLKLLLKGITDSLN